MKKSLKIVLYILGGLFALLLIAIGWLNTQSGKDFIRVRLTAFLSGKLKTEVHIKELDYHVPNTVELHEVLFLDEHKDTMLAARYMLWDVSMLKLLGQKLNIRQIKIEGLNAYIYRIAGDTLFNYSYIPKAFTAKTTTKQEALKAKDSTGSELVIDLNKIVLEDARIRFEDYMEGIKFSMRLQHIDVAMNSLNFMQMSFNIRRLALNGLTTSFEQDKPVGMIKAVVPPVPIKITADATDFKNVTFSYNDHVNKFLLDLQLKNLSTKVRDFDFATQSAFIDNFLLDSAAIKFAIGKYSVIPEKIEAAADTLARSSWRLFTKNLNLKNVDLKYDDENKPRIQYGLDYAHMDIRDLTLNSEDLLFTTDSLMGNIKHLTAKEKSGLDIREFRTRFAYSPQGGYLHDLYLQTPYTVLQNYAEVRYPSVDALQHSPELAYVKINITKSTIGLYDLTLFAPQLRSQILSNKYARKQLRVEAIADGNMNDLTIHNLYASGLSNTVVHVKGKLRGVSDPNKLSYDLNIQRLQSGSSDISAFIPDNITKQVRIPNSFSAFGTLRGTMMDYHPNLVVRSSDGAAIVKGYINLSPGKGREKYDLYVKTDKLNIGRIVRQEQMLGPISVTTNIKGQSFDVNRMSAIAKGDIRSAWFMGYSYSGISFDAKIAKKNADIKLNAADPNAHLKLDAQVNLAGKNPAIKAVLDIDSANLQALGLYKNDMRIRGLVVADIPVFNASYPRGVVTVDRGVVVAGGKRYLLDSLYVSSQPNADSGQYIVVSADAVHAVLTGKTPLSQIGNVMQSHLNRHYQFTKPSPAAMRGMPLVYNLNLNATIYDRPLLHAFIPSLQSASTMTLTAAIDQRTMNINADIPYLALATMTIDSGKINIGETDSALNYTASVKRFAMGSNMEFWYATATGRALHESITSKISIADAARQERFAVSGVYHHHPDKNELHVDDGLKLNYKTWSVSQPNAIVFGKQGFYVQNFVISNGGESVRLNSATPQFSAPMTIAINNFLISNVTEIISKDTLIANGVLNGNLQLKDMFTTPSLSGAFQVTNLTVLNDTIGNIDATLREASVNNTTARIALSGRGNDMVISGTYHPALVNGNNFDLRVDINALNPKTLEGVAMHQVRNTSGYIRGNLQIRGTLDKPVVTGVLRTDNLRTTIAMLGSPFTMPAETIRFTADGIEFSNFKILDSMGNAGYVDGKIYTKDLGNMQFAMTIKANKWQVLNSTEKDNKLFYGRVVVSTNLGIKGPLSAPDVNGYITVHDTTKLTVVAPEKAPGTEERKGIVEFIDMRDTNRYVVLQPADTQKAWFTTGANLSVNVELEKNAEFNIILDQATGDFIRVRGLAYLNTTVDPSGTIGVTGTYELQQGMYEFNYNFIKRRFVIQPGSSIIFAGDPLQAQLNVTAIYIAEIPPYDLVSKRISDPAQLVYYKQRLPFELHLKLAGDIMNPEIGFDVVLPEEKNYRVSPDVVTVVQGRLSELRNNESELTKQVFSVLMLNRFISDNPFESGAGSTASYIARQSVSRLASEELNKIAKELISGLEVNIDLHTTEEYTTGARRNRTDMSIAASKRLLNDRLTVTVGNDFEVEGGNKNSNQNSSLMPGNIAADYQLTSDGRYRMRIFRRDALEDVVEGYVTETGVSFIATLDYNRFKTVFISKRKQLKKAREQNTPTAYKWKW
jgi:translocation and assembly module TamB